MANDSQDLSCLKHRRSDDGESEESSRRRKHHRPDDDESEDRSKRRKHRHHHRHHRRHHHRLGRKKDGEDEYNNEEEVKPKDDEPEGRVGDEVKVIPSVCPILVSNLKPDYDMEEGEIVEDGEFDYQNMRIDEIQDVQEPCTVLPSENAETVNRNSMTLQEENVDANLRTKISVDGEENTCDANKLHENVDSKIRSGNVDCKIRSSSKYRLNGDTEQKYHREDDMPQKVGNFFNEESGKPISYYDEKDDLRDPRKFSSMNNESKRRETMPCPSSGERQCEESRIRNRSRSSDRARERSQSQSIHRDVSLILLDNKKADRKQKFDCDDQRTIDYCWEHRHGSRDLSREKEIDCGSSYSRYRNGQETWDRDREGSREIHDRDRDESGEIRDRASDESQEIGDRDRGESGEIRDRVSDESREIRGRDREGSRDIHDRGREEKEMNRDRRRGKERKRECERDRERGYHMERQRDYDRERVRDYDRNRERERRRESESERGRERDGSRDRYYERDSECVARHRKYDHTDNGHGDRDRINGSRRKRHEEKDRSYKNSKNDAERIHGFKNAIGEVTEEKHGRGEDKLEDFQENSSFQLAEQEEEDLNRIKEESRRRTQAILEKYKVQQQHKLHSNDKVEEHIEQHSDQVASIKVISEDGGVRNEGSEIYVVDTSFSLGKSPQIGPSAVERTSGTHELGEGTPKSEKSDDMFCDDIFGESPAGVRKSGKGEGLAIERSGLHDNWDDPDGYYSYRLGEILDGRYEVTAAHGKGVFSTVVRAKDLKAGFGDPEEVAIKIIRSNDTMYKAGLEELVILKKLVGADPEDKRHCVRFISSFKYRNHLCLVFESLHMNLREVLKKFGRNIGLKLTAVRAYAKQLFIALKHLRNCGVLHCDIKPDNMLVNEAKNVLKLCDFGNAMFSGKNAVTPYLVSRFYRAPEIILGLQYDHPMDMWSVGCCLFELYTGKVLFPGPTNNDMLRLHMELKGPFPKKILRKGSFTDHHFDQDLNFLATEEDPVTKKAIKRLILNIKTKDVGTLISGSPGEDLKMLANFKDLLEKNFVLDPDKRITVSQALSHPFITGK